MEARQSVVSEALEVPVTSLTILALVAVWFRVWSNRIPASCYAYNHRDFKAGEHWRVLTAALAHESPLHLFFNVSTLWSVRHVERELGSFFVLNYSLVLMIFSKLLMHWIYGFVIARTGQQSFANVQTLGYSGVLFGWLAFAASRNAVGQVRFLGLIEIPAVFAPFGAALVTKLLVPNSSFIGHFSGMIGGHLLAFGPLQVLLNAYWTFWFWVTTIMYFGFSFLQTVARQQAAAGSLDDDYYDEEAQNQASAPHREQQQQQQQAHTSQRSMGSTLSRMPWGMLPGMGRWGRLARLATRFHQQVQRQRPEDRGNDSDDERMEAQPLMAEAEPVSTRSRNCV